MEGQRSDGRGSPSALTLAVGSAVERHALRDLQPSVWLYIQRVYETAV